MMKKLALFAAFVIMSVSVNADDWNWSDDIKLIPSWVNRDNGFVSRDLPPNRVMNDAVLKLLKLYREKREPVYIWSQYKDYDIVIICYYDGSGKWQLACYLKDDDNNWDWKYNYSTSSSLNGTIVGSVYKNNIALNSIPPSALALLLKQRGSVHSSYHGDESVVASFFYLDDGSRHFNITFWK